jgi:hypothetical protein
MAGIGMAPCGTVIAEDVRNLQRWTDHGLKPLCRLRLPALKKQADGLARMRLADRLQTLAKPPLKAA